MDYLLDTNILVHRIRLSLTGQKIEQQFRLFSGNHNLIISAVTKGEVLSFAKQSAWGIAKMNSLTALLDALTCVPIDGASALMDAYADIDTYSQGKHLLYPPPPEFTSRNMGKNDLWIAATSFLLDIPLLTTDLDFDHLHPHFISVIKVS
ncbi:MAG: type II toxin-antitoxin system VapC family toxin [Saprospiraceae bacterium]